MQTVRVDPDERRVWSDSEEVRLSRKEFDLLHLLIRNAGRVVSRDELMQQVWHTSFWTSSKTIDVHLGWLRRKIGDDARRPHLITTIRGRGLRFEVAAPQRTQDTARAAAPPRSSSPTSDLLGDQPTTRGPDGGAGASSPGPTATSAARSLPAL